MSELKPTENGMQELKIGDYNTLTITRITEIGATLDGGDPDDYGWGDILLPRNAMPEDCEEGDKLSVFLYFDSEDRIIATTETPLAKVGEFACLRCVDSNSIGAFLDWGLAKDILVPRSQQTHRMREGGEYVVYLYQDKETELIAATAKIGRYLDKTEKDFKVGDTVEGLVMARTDLGFKIIIHHAHTGMVFHNELFTPLKLGQKITAKVTQIREDGKTDLKIAQPNKHDLSDLETKIMALIEKNGGILELGDKTPPEEIYRVLGVSKKNYKRAISRLYKERKILVYEYSVTRV